MDNKSDEYIRLREACISTFKTVCKDSIAFDINEVPQDVRILLLQDQIYLTKTKALKGMIFKKQLEVLDAVLDEQYGDEKRGTAPSDIMKAIEMKNKIFFSDMNIDADESNALNITMQMYTKEDMEKLDTVTVFMDGSNNAKLTEDDAPPVPTSSDPLAQEIARELQTNPAAQETESIETLGKASEVEW